MKYYLGIDIGTQSIKVIAFDVSGNAAAGATRDQYMDTPHVGWATEKPRIWWNKVVECVREVTAKVGAGSIAGVGVGAVTHSPVPLGRDGALLEENVQMYCDKRNGGIVERYLQDYQQKGIHRITSNPPASNWMGIKIAWIRENQPDVYERTCKFVAPKDYINFKLTGEMGTDWSEGSGTMLIDHETMCYSDDALRYMHVDREKMPVIRRSCDIVGCVTRAAAEETGLREGTPVVAGAGDMPCALFSAGLVEPGACVDLIGTGSVFAVYGDTPIIDRQVMNLHCASEGWSPYFSMDSSGGAFRWFRDTMAKQETAQAKAAGESPFTVLSRLVEQTPPGADGVMFFPYLQGERTFGTPFSKGTFTGMTVGTGIGHLNRAIFEGIAYDCKTALLLFERFTPIDVVILTGGASVSDTWSQIKADVYGKRVVTTAQTETTAFGAALLAAVADGTFANGREAAKATARYNKEFIPNPENVERYTEFYRVFMELHDAFQAPYQHLAKLLG